MRYLLLALLLTGCYIPPEPEKCGRDDCYCELDNGLEWRVHCSVCGEFKEVHPVYDDWLYCR